MLNSKEKFKQRLLTFSICVVQIVKMLPKNYENIIFIKQLIRSSSSIGANYAEATFAYSKVDFIHCLNICRKEANETLYWLELLVAINPKQKEQIQPLIGEVTELLKILVASVKTSRSSSNSK